MVCASGARSNLTANGCPICRVPVSPVNIPAAEAKARAKPKAKPKAQPRSQPPGLTDAMRERWVEADTRQEIPGDDVDYDNYNIIMREAPFDASGIYHCMKYMEYRNLKDKFGRPYARMCAWLLKRMKGSRDKPIIRVVYVDEMCPYFGRETRTYSGLSRFPSVPPVRVAHFLEHELTAGVPRSMIGKSIFDLGGKLYRIMARSFGIPSSQFKVYEMDIDNAQVQLCYKDWIYR